MTIIEGAFAALLPVVLQGSADYCCCRLFRNHLGWAEWFLAL